MIQTHPVRPARMPLVDTVRDPRAVQLGTWLQERRLNRGMTRPEAVREGLKHDPRAALSPDYLAKLEYGDRSLASAALDVREALRIALNLTPEQWEQATGLALPRVASQVRQAAHVPQIPEELAKAVESYGVNNQPLTTEKWQRFLASMHFTGKRPETARDWYNLYHDLERHGVDPQ